MENLPRRRRRWSRIWRPALLLLFLALCLGSVALVMFADQADVLANAYINAATQGNDGAAALLGDHFSEDQNFNQKMFALDFQRDSEYLNGAQISGLSLERTQSLSGQWMTVARFDYRPLGSSDWRSAELRVKTANWLFITYIRAVESVEQ